ncbi:TlpA disulfide reductase family protein [Blastococcus sp. LR1]|uniref:TlpA family protein disulfide reductase n=1 Tax=Blastococcus sp. LR1 TaxID=2877000 RepID=UPI001CCAFEA4|nr:TlpA disulfide reductase family protein [Blastococcus sp. LR1]MCA0143838.1 TlpA family protein disulfide reductase [Blastococcus sp. LR1]
MTTAAAAPPCETSTGVAAIGPEVLPPLTLACLGPGPEVALDQLTGRPTLVNLWATWCLPCREEMPLLQDAFERYGEQVRFLGVDTQDSPEAAASFVTDLQIGYAQVLDPDGALLTELGVRGLPVTLGLDADGRIVARVVGQLDAQELQQLIDTLLS